jgi:hypothetical protein
MISCVPLTKLQFASPLNHKTLSPAERTVRQITVPEKKKARGVFFLSAKRSGQGVAVFLIDIADFFCDD